MQIKWAHSTSEAPLATRVYTTERDWEVYKDRILKLRKKNVPVSEIRTILQRETGFEASERQYKQRLRKWSDRRYFTKKQRQYINQQIQMRGGEIPRFLNSGEAIDPSKVQSIWNRRGRDGVPPPEVPLSPNGIEFACEQSHAQTPYMASAMDWEFELDCALVSDSPLGNDTSLDHFPAETHSWEVVVRSRPPSPAATRFHNTDPLTWSDLFIEEFAAGLLRFCGIDPDYFYAVNTQNLHRRTICAGVPGERGSDVALSRSSGWKMGFVEEIDTDTDDIAVALDIPNPSSESPAKHPQQSREIRIDLASRMERAKLSAVDKEYKRMSKNRTLGIIAAFIPIDVTGPRAKKDLRRLAHFAVALEDAEAYDFDYVWELILEAVGCRTCTDAVQHLRTSSCGEWDQISFSAWILGVEVLLWKETPYCSKLAKSLFDVRGKFGLKRSELALRSLLNLGLWCDELGLYSETTILLEECKILAEDLHLPPTNTYVLRIEHRLLYDDLRRRLGDTADALETHLLDYLKIREMYYPNDTIQISNVLGDLGMYYRRCKDYVKSITHLERSLFLDQCLYGKRHPVVLEKLDFLADILLERGFVFYARPVTYYIVKELSEEWYQPLERKLVKIQKQVAELEAAQQSRTWY